MALGFSKKNRTKQGKELESPKNQKENPFSTKNPFSKDTNSKTKATLKFVGVLLFITFTTQFMTAGRPNPVTAFALEYGPKKQVEMQIKNTPQATLDSLETHLEQLFIGDNKKEIFNFLFVVSYE